MEKDLRKKIEEIIETGAYSQGKTVTEFERELATYLGVKARQVVAVSSGTAALHLAIQILKLREVTVPACSFISVANMVKLSGCELSYVDVDARTWNAKEATIGLDLLGNPVDYNPVIEDAAEALGSVRYDGKKCGTLGEISCLSFFENKIITTGGEGGALICKDEADADKARLLRQQGKNRQMLLHRLMGYNYRMTEIQAAIGIAELKKIEERVRAKRRIYKQYKETLGDLVLFQEECEGCRSNRWFTAIQVIERGKKWRVIEALSSAGIYWRNIFAPLYWHAWLPQSRILRVSEHLYETVILLPSFPTMGEEQVAKVCEIVENGIKNFDRGGYRRIKSFS